MRAIVIGASSGIGAEVARILIVKGWHLALAARRTEPLHQLQNLAPDRVTYAALDVTATDAEQCLDALFEQMQGVDLFFYSAGIGKQNMELAPDVERATVETNSLAFTRMVGVAYRRFASAGKGHIAVITSIAGTKGMGAAPSYSATKAFQGTYLQALEQQARMRKLDIAFTDLRPGFVDTPLLAGTGHYPMMLNANSVAQSIVKAIEHHRHVKVIDWRWSAVTAMWRRIPRPIWRRMKVR